MIELTFLFWLFLIGILVATFQDLKRREVDNWLNLLLILISLSYVFYKALYEKNPEIILLTGFIIAIMFVIMNIFYYGRVFGGGDAGLLFAMSAFFIGVEFIESATNIGIFILFLMVSGSIYGTIYSSILYIKNREKVNKEIKKGIKKHKKILLAIPIISVAFYFLSNSLIFKLLSIIIFISPLLYIFAKGLENISMTKTISGKDLREGDWLADKERIGKKVINYSWEGLSKEEVRLLSKKKKVKIKEGLPFVPAFLMAFILYALLRTLFN
ncbi:MAG: prepilin peptidase [Candidatus Pacearchaeota archaeon]